MSARQPTPSHPFAEVFPLREEEIPKLADRIKRFGQREKIVLYDGRVLSGRRRERACHLAGVTPQYRDFGSRGSDGDDPLEWVYDQEYHRRNMTDGERIVAAAFYARHRGGGKKPPAQNAQVNPSPEKTGPNGVSPDKDSQESPPTNAAAAQKFNVPEAAVRRAKAAINKGASQSVVLAIAEGVCTATDANAVAGESKSLQNMAVRKVRQGKYVTLKQAVDALRPQPGDGRETGRGGNGRAPKVGAPLVKWKDCEADLAKAARWLGAIGAAYPKRRNGEAFKRAERAGEEYLAAMTALKSEVTHLEH